MTTPHLVWDWNGTLLDDLPIVVAATNVALAAVGGGPVTADEHRRDYRRPISDYYGYVLGRLIDDQEFALLDGVFHQAYGESLATCALSDGAEDALRGWPGTQSLLSMWFHDNLVPTVHRFGIADHFRRVDGLRDPIGGGSKAPHLAAHLDALGLDGRDCVLIGDSVDDAYAATSVGARCVLYEGGFTHPERLRETGLPVVSTLSQAVRLALG